MKILQIMVASALVSLASATADTTEEHRLEKARRRSAMPSDYSDQLKNILVLEHADLGGPKDAYAQDELIAMYYGQHPEGEWQLARVRYYAPESGKYHVLLDDLSDENGTVYLTSREYTQSIIDQLGYRLRYSSKLMNRHQHAYKPT